ncbi:hypothetical protein FLBR109950_09045 [Flavobacterium branchiophilum]|uniref:VWA domain-containing protein n=1 Tax=Flavobacterium branchiophilum (strain FL-15) TaxID=1034807 RepID=G2Z1M2_FLABF|nr:hypothetical protein [Flavobacterium branchiophilum]CCB69794.1 Probable transmembrane protein of unknown function [Flavobacterium branchiophilum FL-15]
MNTTTILLIFLAVLIAIGIAFYQYIYKNTNKSKTILFLACLRFFSVFILLLLLINPVISRNTFEIVKTPLAIVMDNSSSIKNLFAQKTATDVYQQLAQNADLKTKFDVQLLKFDDKTEMSQQIDFKGTKTNIDGVGTYLKNILKNNYFPTVIITDGNQTSGNDYTFSFPKHAQILPIVVGDTTTFLDLKINQLNVNKYAFYKNKFPVEVFLQYSGNKPVHANFSITNGNNTLVKQAISFSKNKKSAVLQVLLPADKMGLQIYKAQINSSEKERNIHNNIKNFAIDIIDQKTNIALVSAISHPDLGAIKRAIETNNQRKVTILKPTAIQSLQDFNVLLLYQPNESFKNIFDLKAKMKLNALIITGLHTDFNFLNQNQTDFVFQMTTQKEDYLAAFEEQFNLFAIEPHIFNELPPLQNPFGKIISKAPNQVLLNAKIRNINTQQPLFTFVSYTAQRNAYLFGENIWKWRLQEHLNQKSFEKFDQFLDKTIQFLASNDRKKSLIVHHEHFYNASDLIEITAEFFNKNYEFDEKAKLTISIINKDNKKQIKYDFLKNNNSFKVNLEGLEAGHYQFIVKEINTNAVYNSFFEIAPFDIEKQFVNPEVLKLQQLAQNYGGKCFYPTQTPALIKQLLDNPNYKPTEKAIVKKTPLIDWEWLLALLAIVLSVEWFVRKYNGLL